jgi:hypothetical protein
MPKALGFGYCEALLHAPHRDVILDEIKRLENMNRMLDDAGHSRDLYEDFTQPTMDLLKELADRLPCRDDGKYLLDRFNEEGVSSAIITHFRVRGAAERGTPWRVLTEPSSSPAHG